MKKILLLLTVLLSGVILMGCADSEIKLNTYFVVLETNETYTLKATLTDETNTFTWSSSDSNIVSVTDNGVITAVKEGEAQIYATINEKHKATCRVIVSAELKQARTDATKTVNDKVNSLKESDYSADNWKSIKELQAIAIIAINGLDTKEDIEKIVGEFTTDVDAIPKAS